MSRFDPLVDVAMAMLPLTDGLSSKHFSFILLNSKILAVGVNEPFKTHPLAKKYKYKFSSIHSELSAVLKLRHKIDFSRCRLINIRLSGDSIRLNHPVLRMSMPCECCQKWLLALGFRQIWYSTNDGFEKF